MSIKFKYLDKGEYLIVDIECTSNYVKAEYMKLIDDCTEKKWYSIIIDAGNINWDIHIAEQYQLVTQIFFLKDSPLKRLAVVMTHELSEKFGNKIIDNANFPIKVFENLDNAEAWVRKNAEQVMDK